MIKPLNSSLEWPGWLLMPVVIGYIIMTRSFAHWGVPPLYIGEATLGMLLLLRPGVIFGTWVRAQLKPQPIAVLAILSTVFVVYGFLQFLRGLSESEYPKLAVQNFAFNFYVSFLFAGMWLGERHPKLIQKLVWYLAWINGIYGIVYLLKLGASPIQHELDASAVQTFGQPAGSAIALLGMFVFQPNLLRCWLPLLLNVLVLLGGQVRAEWLAFGLAVTLLSVLSGRIKRLALIGVAIGGLLLVGLIVDFRIPSPTSRGGVISSRDLIGRAVAAVDDDAAKQLTEHSQNYSGTVEWRKEWWNNLLELTHKRGFTTLFGMGYGYPIWELNFLSEGVNPTPHNIFIYSVTYTGWVGVMIFYSLQFYLAWLLWKGYRASGEPFGICLWVLLFVWAHFDNRLETPYGAIPFYVLVGMALTSMTSAGAKSAIAPPNHREAAV